jgi:hypothetical protein
LATGAQNGLLQLAVCQLPKRYREWALKLYAYGRFTDVEFNPYKSINCQARSCALFLSLMKKDVLDEATQSPYDFIRLLTASRYRPHIRDDAFSGDRLFAAELRR